MGAGSHRFFDHTGDYGVELAAPTREALYEEVGRAWVTLLTDAPAAVEERERRAIAVEGVDAEDLLVALGNELLYLFETEGWIAARLSIEELDESALRAVAYGEPYDPERHAIARPVKAVTHHGATLEADGDGFRGRLLFDL